MADQQVGNVQGFAAAGIGGGTNRSNLNGTAADTPQASLPFANYGDIAAMRARLATINAALYTAAMLNRMTANDMAYAIRLADQPTSIKQ